MWNVDDNHVQIFVNGLLIHHFALICYCKWTARKSGKFRTWRYYQLQPFVFSCIINCYAFARSGTI